MRTASPRRQDAARLKGPACLLVANLPCPQWGDSTRLSCVTPVRALERTPYAAATHARSSAEPVPPRHSTRAGGK